MKGGPSPQGSHLSSSLVRIISVSKKVKEPRRRIFCCPRFSSHGNRGGIQHHGSVVIIIRELDDELDGQTGAEDGQHNEHNDGTLKHTDRTWWRHQMETFSALLALYAGNSPVTGEFPSQRLVTRGFEAFSDLRLNKRLSKQSRRRWFETPSRPFWRHCNEMSLHLATTTTKLQVFSEKVLGCSWFRSNHLCWPFGVIHNGWRNLTKSRLESLRWCAQPTPSWWLQMSWRQIGRKPSETTKLTLLLRLLGILIHINHATWISY